MATEITITGWTIEEVAEAVARSLLRADAFDLDGLIRERAQTFIDERVKEITAAAIEKGVREALEEGWAETNRYGEPTGKRMTLRERIAAMLTEPTGDYNNRGPRIEAIAREVLQSALRKEFGQEIEAGRKKLAAAVDDVIKAKLADTLKTALGLR